MLIIKKNEASKLPTIAPTNAIIKTENIEYAELSESGNCNNKKAPKKANVPKKPPITDGNILKKIFDIFILI